MKAAIPILSLLLIFFFVSIPARAQEPQVSTQLLKRFEGAADGDNLGFSVSFIADVDSDGSPDILLGAPGASPGGLSGAGTSFLYSGGTFSLIHQFDGQSVGEDFGVSVAGAGDLSGDGIPDILIGADASDPGGRVNAGSVYVYSGSSPFGLISRLDGEVAGDFFGTSLASLGNLAGDGRPEFAVGAIGADPGNRTNAGRVYVFNGDLSVLTRLDGTTAQDDFGVSVAGPGDVNGDSIPDILVGADLTNPSNPARVNAGSAYLFSGQSLTLLHRFDGEVAGDFFGSSVSGVGDVNGDSLPDLLVGAPGADPANMTEAGSAYLFSGASYALLHRFDGGSIGDDFGWRVAAAGDVNGNSFPDLVVAADLADHAGIADVGSVYLYSGSDYSLLAQVDGEAESDNLGSLIAGGADTNGDGMPDFLAGAPYNSPNGLLEAGSAYLYKTNPLPVPRFSFNPAKPLIGELVSFDASASSSPNGPIISYSWTFGDGGTATGVTVSHTYAAQGSYTASLTIVDSTNVAVVRTQTVVVNPPNQPPIAGFTYSPVSPLAGQTVSFDASASSDADGTITFYSWNLGDGSTRTGVTTIYTYATPATYQITLIVTDDRDSTNSTTQQLQILPALTISASADTTGGLAPLAVQFTSQASGGQAPYTSLWTFGDGQSTPGPSTSHEYTIPGSYQSRVTVNDSLGNTVFQTITITVVSTPVLTVTASSNTTGGIVPLPVSFTSQVSGGTAPYSYSWNFGDGQGSSSQSVTHQYSLPGSYQATVTVTDSLANTASDTIMITVVPVPQQLTVAASSDLSGGISPVTVQFSAQASGGQGSYTFSWDYGDGQTGTGSPSSHTYNTPRNYTVRVTVQDAQGNTASDTLVVTVVEQPTPRVGPIPAEYLLYGLLAAIAAIVILAAFYLRGPRSQKPAA